MRYFVKDYRDGPNGKVETLWTAELAFRVALFQDGKGSFVVQYGRQISDGLFYSDAVRELGSAIMHALACDGIITDDNA